MTEHAWTEIQRGRPEKAVKLMERAVPVLAGSADRDEGYAYDNLGRGGAPTPAGVPRRAGAGDEGGDD